MDDMPDFLWDRMQADPKLAERCRKTEVSAHDLANEARLMCHVAGEMMPESRTGQLRRTAREWLVFFFEKYAPERIFSIENFAELKCDAKAYAQMEVLQGAIRETFLEQVEEAFARCVSETFVRLIPRALFEGLRVQYERAMETVLADNDEDFPEGFRELAEDVLAGDCERPTVPGVELPEFDEERPYVGGIQSDAWHAVLRLLDGE